MRSRMIGVSRSDSVSPVAAPAVGASLVAFIVVYTIIFAAGTVYLLRLMARPPQAGERGPDPDAPQHASGIAAAPMTENATEDAP